MTGMHGIGWQVPAHEVFPFWERRTKYCVTVPVLNEGERLLGQLRKMRDIGIPAAFDLLILDGGSTDGSTAQEVLRELGIRALLVKAGEGKQSAQMRIGYAFALREGYEGIINIDGNGKDSVDSIPLFAEKLDDGYDLVQGSRHLPGGGAVNTPLIRRLAIRLIHVPVIRHISGYRFTDTTNGFRAYSRRYLLDLQVQPFRSVFVTYELLGYLSVRAPQIGLRTTEVPVRRTYPATGRLPTKIRWSGCFDLLRILWNLWRGYYTPERAG